MKITHCPSTLLEGYSTYSSSALKNLFEGKKVNHVLPYLPPSFDEGVTELFIENRKRISISGVQEKLSLVLDEDELRLSHQDEQGRYILKPIPRDLQKVEEVPANEHLTMQLAKQVYKIPIAENALIFFQDNSPAYLTKRFDVKSDGAKYGKEDFATLAQKTYQNAGPNFKYDYSYEEMSLLIKKYVPAYKIEIEKFFSLVVFNYLFSNGDAHLKNFSLLETVRGDYVLSPAYDLINTRLHIKDSEMALSDGLFKEYETESYQANGFFAYDDFYEFGLKIGMSEKRVIKKMAVFCKKQESVEKLVKQSFLVVENQELYYQFYLKRLKALNYSFTKKNG